MNADVTVSVIGMNHRDMLKNCLASLFETTQRHSLEVFVVDNASNDGTAEMVVTEFPLVNLIRNTSVMGFSSNNNRVLEQANGRFALLLNDDMVILPGAVDAMADFMDAHPEAAVAGGQLLNRDGSPQISFFAFPHPLLEAFHPLTDRWRVRWAQSDRAFEVDWVCGASLMVRREILGQVGLLDLAFDPAYSEETDWCYRIRKQGGHIFAVPSAQFIHFGGQSMDPLASRRMELLYSKRALYFQKHRGLAARRLFKAALWLASLAKLLAWIALRPFRGERARHQIALHWHLVRRAPWL